jgi:hypothetical protein
MRPLLHLLSVVFVLPGALLAAAFIILGRAIATQSLLGILGQLLSDALWIVPWGALGGLAAILLVAIGGFFARTRRMAGLCVATVGVGSAAVVLFLTIRYSTFTPDQLTFFVPGILASCIGLWLAAFDRGDQALIERTPAST